MVTFICHYCDLTLKKKQVDNHIRGRCSPGAMICIDCSQTFYGNDHKNHISCISEQEKHWGQFAKLKTKKNPNGNSHPDQNKNHNEGSTLDHSNNRQQHKMEQQKNKSQQKTDKNINAQKKLQPQDKNKQQVVQKEKSEGWRGWKTQIKAIIEQHENRIQKQDLMKKLRKVYRAKMQRSTNQQEQNQMLTKEQFNKTFNQKLSKIRRIKTVTVTYCSLEQDQQQ